MDKAEANLERIIKNRSTNDKENSKSRSNFKKNSSNITQGLAYLFNGNPVSSLIHGDIKPQNILLLNGEYVLSDFGTSKVIIKIQMSYFYFNKIIN